MRTQLKHLSKLQGKKRYFLMGFLALELLSLPAAAQIVHRVAFEVRPLVTAVEIPTAEPGLSRFLVASNAGFGVTANNVIGDISTMVHISGTISDTSRFGDAAQLPGAEETCALSTGTDSTIYIADRKTAAVPGTPPEQAVIFEFRYHQDGSPSFNFIPGDNKTPRMLSCDTANS